MMYVVTVAYKDFYREKTNKLIESVKEYLPEAIIYILTDEISYYDSYSNVVAVEGPICDFNPYFKANIKSFSLLSLLPVIRDDDVVLYLDADCYFIKDFPHPISDYIDYGLSTHISEFEPERVLPNTIYNRAIKNKILTINPDESQLYYIFREGFLLFKVDERFREFVKAWIDIYEEIESKQLTHANQTFDIQNAALRAGLPIHNIGKLSPFRGTTVTIAVNGGVNCLV
jgi:hypothetical protein